MFGSKLSPSEKADRELKPTAYLDGLRGLSAVIVFIFRFTSAFTNAANTGYAAHTQTHTFLQLPLIRLCYDGGMAVNVFFAVGGYVCSTGLISQMSQGHYEKALRSLSSSAFRAIPRLWAPVLFCTFVSANLAYLGIFDFARPLIMKNKLPESQLKRFDSWPAQIHFWGTEMFQLADMWRADPFYPQHDNHLWSIPYEFRIRIHLYVGLLLMATLRPKARLYGLIFTSFIYEVWNRWDGLVVFLGAALAQWEWLQQNSSSPMIGRPSRMLQPIVRLGRYALYIVALYLMSYPTHNAQTPSTEYNLVAHLAPFFTKWQPWRFPKTVGTILLLYLLGSCEDRKRSLWHRALNSELVQYLGTVSFGLYIIHGPVIHIFGWCIPYAVWTIVGKNTALTWSAGIAAGLTFSLIPILWLAEMMNRSVIGPTTQMTRYLETKYFTP